MTRELERATETLGITLSDLLAFSPTSTLAIAFSLLAISRSRMRAMSDFE